MFKWQLVFPFNQTEDLPVLFQKLDQDRFHCTPKQLLAVIDCVAVVSPASSLPHSMEFYFDVQQVVSLKGEVKTSINFVNATIFNSSFSYENNFY